MGVTIKSPAGDITGKENTSPKSKGPQGGVFDGEEGYKKRSPNSGVPERTTETITPKKIDIKTPFTQ